MWCTKHNAIRFKIVLDVGYWKCFITLPKPTITKIGLGTRDFSNANFLNIPFKSITFDSERNHILHNMKLFYYWIFYLTKYVSNNWMTSRQQNWIQNKSMNINIMDMHKREYWCQMPFLNRLKKYYWKQRQTFCRSLTDNISLLVWIITDNIWLLIRVVAWYWRGDIPLSEVMANNITYYASAIRK